jgi:hypothetical protein
MKAFASLPLQSPFRINPVSMRLAEPVFVSTTSSMHLRPMEIRRYLRHLRESRQYNFTRDFVY